MQKFLLKILIFAGILALIFAAAYRLYLRAFPIEISFYSASLDKHRLLATRESPRLIFIGGSSLTYGIDSGRIGERLGYHPVNMGLHVGIGLELMLEEVEPAVRPGDIVVVTPEYLVFDQFYWSRASELTRLLECNPSIWRVLSWNERKELLDRGFVQHLGRVLRFALTRNEIITDRHDDIFRRTSFNENGDFVAHHGLPSRGAWGQYFHFSDPASAAAAVAHLNRFHQHCAARGVRVFFSHAPYEKKHFEQSREAIQRLERLLHESLNIPMLDRPEDLVFPGTDFFDSAYHLNLPAKTVRSERLADNLARALATR